MSTTQPPKPKRRWYQFSLRTLLIVMTVLCLGFGLLIRPVNDRIVLSRLNDEVGSAWASYEWGRIRRLYLHEAKITDAGLEQLKELTSLRFVDFYRSDITDAGLEHLKGLTNLERLGLARTNITDAGLEHVKGLTNLKELRLDSTKVTNAGLEHLRGLTELESLNVWATQVTDEGVKRLQQALPNCKILH